MSEPVILSILSGEKELFDPAVTGQFADAMAHIAAQPQTPPWCGYIGRRGEVPVGFGGFKGEPAEDGSIEIGYLTFPLHEGSGVAKAVAGAMIEIARINNVKTVLAQTLPEENASTGVLRANGFDRDGMGMDADVGEVWCWKLTL